MRESQNTMLGPYHNKMQKERKEEDSETSVRDEAKSGGRHESPRAQTITVNRQETTDGHWIPNGSTNLVPSQASRRYVLTTVIHPLPQIMGIGDDETNKEASDTVSLSTDTEPNAGNICRGTVRETRVVEKQEVPSTTEKMKEVLIHCWTTLCSYLKTSFRQFINDKNSIKVVTFFVVVTFIILVLGYARMTLINIPLTNKDIIIERLTKKNLELKDRVFFLERCIAAMVLTMFLRMIYSFL